MAVMMFWRLHAVLERSLELGHLPTWSEVREDTPSDCNHRPGPVSFILFRPWVFGIILICMKMVFSATAFLFQFYGESWLPGMLEGSSRGTHPFDIATQSLTSANMSVRWPSQLSWASWGEPADWGHRLVGGPWYSVQCG